MQKPASKIRRLKAQLKRAPVLWSRTDHREICSIVTEFVVAHSNEMVKFPYSAGIFTALFPEFPLAIFPVPESVGRKAYAAFGHGFAWARENPLASLRRLAELVSKTLGKMATGIAVMPLPERLEAERRGLNDTRCCVPMACAILSDTSFLESYRTFEALGRKHRHGTMTRSTLSRDARMLGCRFVRYDSVRGYTIAQWLRGHPKGRYLILTARHGTAVIDGVPFDHTPLRPRARVRAWYEVLKQNPN